MTIYDIDQEILSLIDPETGEIADYDAFENLQMERGAKIENMSLWYKELTAQGKAIREEEKALSERRKACEKKAERLKKYLAEILQGEKFKTAKVSVSYRNSEALEIDDKFIEWAKKNNVSEYLTYAEPAPNKSAIKDAIKSGETVEFAEIVKRQNVIIK